MKPMAAGLSPEELTSLIGYLTSGQKAVDAHWTDAMMCPADDRAVDTGRPVAFGGFGVDARSTRSLSAAQSGLTRAQLSKLEVAWAIGFPQTQSLGVGAVVLGDTVYVTAAGKLLALDARRGCGRWARDMLSHNTPQIAEIAGRKVLVLADTRVDGPRHRREDRRNGVERRREAIQRGRQCPRRRGRLPRQGDRADLGLGRRVRAARRSSSAAPATAR